MPKQYITVYYCDVKNINLKADFIHKLTTRVYRENQTIVIQDLNMANMLNMRNWLVPLVNCGAVRTRNINVARNLKRLATKNALPVASQSVTNDTGLGIISTSGGKVTPVRYECSFKDTSGQEINRDHICSLF